MKWYRKSLIQAFPDRRTIFFFTNFPKATRFFVSEILSYLAHENLSSPMKTAIGNGICTRFAVPNMPSSVAALFGS